LSIFPDASIFQRFQVSGFGCQASKVLNPAAWHLKARMKLHGITTFVVLEFLFRLNWPLWRPTAALTPDT
jgi:hypothetical protein